MGGPATTRTGALATHAATAPRRALAASLLALLLALASARAGLASDWPQWRGPGRDGAARGFRAPAAWPAELSQKWKVTVGEGHASPVVAGERVFLFARVGEEEVLLCLDAATGGTLWRAAHDAPYTMHQAATSHGKGPKSTPVVAGGLVCTLGISGTLSCHDAGTGALKWRRSFQRRFGKGAPLYGAAMSPLVDDGVLVAHVGGHGGGALGAFSVATGETVWSWEGDGPGYASPILATFDGVTQVVTQTRKQIVGIDRASGALLWSVPFTTPWEQNIVTPIRVGDTIVVSGLEQGTRALRPARAEEGWTVGTTWTTDAVSLYMNSPVVAGERLCGLSHLRKGQFFCVEASSGRVVWTSEGREADHASTVVAGDLLLHLTDAAELIVMRADGGAPVARYTVADSPVWAHPAFVDGDILVKDATTLARLSFRGPPPVAPRKPPDPRGR